MKNPVYEQIQARKVKARLRMLQHAQRVSGSVSQTCRFFGVSRSLYYIWKKRFESKLSGPTRPQAETSPHPLSHSAGDRFPDSTDSRGTSIRGRANELVPPEALPCLRFTNNHSETFSPPSRGANLDEKVSPRPQAGRRSPPGSGAFGAARCEIRSTNRTCTPTLLPVHGHRRGHALPRLAHL